ncbi:MAG: ATP-binding cassette domain-containing protein [Chitinispirillia bacterium]|jgi:ABC-2 type transport system ATP-binding protein
MISVKNLYKSFRVHKKEPGLKNSIKSLFIRKWIINNAISDVTFKVEKGEILGLVGANGAGKTTLVKVLSGIIHPDSGTVRVLGFNPWDRKYEFRRQIALIMGQKAQLWWDLPAGDCFLLLKEIYQIPPGNFNENLEFLAETLNVKKQMAIQIRRLSLGERMKMELIAALLHNPKIVYLDEPTIGLDLTAQRAIRNFILNYRQMHTPAMILTSHYMEDIEQMCKRIVILRKGRIIFDGLLDTVVKKFAKHKIIKAQLKNTLITNTDFNLPEELGKVIPSDNGSLKVKAQRIAITDAATYILQNLPVKDLTIEEEGIGTVIEALQKEN